MAQRKAQQNFIKGTATHRRTERDYMGVLLDTVTLDDWRDVVAGTLAQAKDGDPAARTWLASYLVGRPETKAPAPLTIVLQQLNGSDPRIDRLAKPHLDRVLYPSLHQSDDWEAGVKARVAEELAAKLGAVDSPPMLTEDAKAA